MTFFSFIPTITPQWQGSHQQTGKLFLKHSQMPRMFWMLPDSSRFSEILQDFTVLHSCGKLSNMRIHYTPPIYLPYESPMQTSAKEPGFRNPSRVPRSKMRPTFLLPSCEAPEWGFVASFPLLLLHSAKASCDYVHTRGPQWTLTFHCPWVWTLSVPS